MSNCTRCGAYIPVGDTACPACGYDPEKEKAEQQQSGFSGGAAQARQPRYEGAAQTSGSYESVRREEKADSQAMTWAPWNQKEEEEETGGWESAPSRDMGEDERVRRLSVLSYVGPLFLLPLLLHKDNAFVRFHANQGLLLFLAELVVEICLGGVLWLAGAAFCLYCLVLGAKAAAAGKCVKLPLLGDIQLIK